MITFKWVEFQDRPEMVAFMKTSFGYEENASDYLFGVYERNEILGTCLFEYDPLAKDKAIVKGLFIREDQRRMKLGDGLIRSTLHYLERQDITEVKLLTNPLINPLYDFEGFEIKTTVHYVTKLPDFFLKPCKSSIK